MSSKTPKNNNLNAALDEHAIVSIADVKGNISYVNDKFCAISGFSRDELIGQNHRILKSDEHLPEIYKDLWRTISGGKTWHGELKNIRKNGESYWVKASIVPFLNEKGIPFQYVAIRTDISQEKELEKSLRESETKHRLLFSGMTQGVVYQNADGSIISANSAAENILSLSLDQMQGKTSLDPRWKAVDTDGNDFTGDTHPAMVALRTGESVLGVLMGVHIPDQENYRWISIDAVPQFIDGEDKPYQVFTTFSDVTKQRESEVALLKAKEDADKANHAKSEFLSSMSHELRTPLNAILGFTQLMQFNPKTPLTAAQKDSTDQVIKGGNHLLELIDQVLELAKIEAGKMSVSIEPVAIRELLDECIAMVETLAQKRDISININTDDCPDVEVDADHTRFKQVLLNLLSNAVKYNSKGGSISVTTRIESDDTCHIAVADTGPGIAKDQQEGIFQPFNRLGHETSGIEGTGIGLVITRELMHLMKGEVGFESEVGKGSTFWVEMPLSTQATAATPEIAQARGDAPALATDDIGNEGQSYTALYIEDNPANLRLMEGVMAMIPNIELISTPNAELGLEIAQDKIPDLILMDLNLPGMDGYEALERLKVNKKTKSIPVIAVTAQATKADITRGRHAGFKGYITKPLQVPELIQTIKETLEGIKNTV